MVTAAEQSVINFHLYPPIGDDDWRYGFATAQVRALETQMLSRPTLLDMANTANFTQAIELLSSTEYAVSGGGKTFEQVQEFLLEKRSEVRGLFKKLVPDEPLIQLLKEKDDFANLRLALRRKLTDKPIGTDYSNEGSIPAEEFEQIFEQENYAPLPMYMKEAIESAVLAYYQNKNVRDIDFSLDASQAEYKISTAQKLKNIFLEGLFKIQVDLINIRTMLRLKFSESELRNVFIEGGFIEIERLKHGLSIGYEAVAALFFATPYYETVDSGVSYLSSNKSFLKLEANCDKYIAGFLKQTQQITAGPQPVIAYLLNKESEIRTVRLILTGKKNNLQAKLILDRLGE
ncbi:MAG: V-type ATPase subunit [Phycisphaerae bacterium]